MKSSSHIITTNKQTSSFLQAGCPSCRPTNSVKALKGKYHTFHGFAYPKLMWGLPTLYLTTNSSWLPWGSVDMPLIIPLMPVPQFKDIIAFTKLNELDFITLPASCSTVYCNRSCLFVCVCGWVCYHDNSIVRASILTKLGLYVKVVTIAS